LPLDYSGFDESISKEMLSIFFENLGQKFNYAHTLWYQLDNMKWFWKSPSGIQYEGEWKNGLPSGWKTTSIIGSLFNTFIVRAALISTGKTASYIAVHGDDLDMEVRSYHDAVVLSAKINEFGFEVSPLKTSIGTTTIH
jgi:hypothetical protein